ncbi:signal peptidase I [Alkalicoccobacillus gibsonii]|jgi:signal peptidase I|uniref:Signal peptidase I n=1 Tax=Alkalicoccobacillus gibsonii TaxID=79881 RepID=A0ABU9VLV2_9BACI|nr:signal peptidase I [Alkalicoccobacillus gibsonii]MBM0065178.1 signal peptidase I [Alkalicoccobacillus gibsonii]
MEKKRSESWEWVKAIAIALLLAFVIRTFMFASVVVDGESMQPTLEPDDKLIVNKIGLQLSEPERFDIMVFHAPGGNDYIKRVIGLPGEEIEYKDDTLYVNQEPVAEPFLDEMKQRYEGEILTGDFTLEELPHALGPVVPEDSYFVMGDNRRRSKDSRDIGAVHKEDMIGGASLTFWPIRNIKITE